MPGETTYYTLLHLNPDASPEAVRSAFAALVKQLPPAADPATNSHYQKLLQAYEVLNDPDQRATYDSSLAASEPAPLRVHVQASRTQLPVVGAPQMLYLLIEASPTGQTHKARRPLNLCLVLDRSTSMRGSRLTFLKSAVELLLAQLAPDDIISIITFSDRAEVVQTATHVHNKSDILSQVRGIRASGGTEIYQGLIAGFTEMRQTPLPRYNNHLILLTDGHTYGDSEECFGLATRATASQIVISAFGLGNEWNDEFLDKLVASSGGQSAFIEEPSQILGHLRQRIQGLGTVHARNVRLSPGWDPGVSLRYGFKLLPFAQPLNLTEPEIKLGNIEGKGSLSILLELTLPPQPREAIFTLPLTLVGDAPNRQDREWSIQEQVQLVVTADPPEETPPQDLIKAVRMLNMYRMNEKVWAEIEAGNVDLAATRLRHLTTRLLEAGEIKLAQQAFAETERLHTVGSLSPAGRKKLKYGTRAMIGKIDKIDNHDSM